MPPGESHVSRISKEYYVNYFNSSHRELGPPVLPLLSPAQPYIAHVHLHIHPPPMYTCTPIHRTMYTSAPIYHPMYTCASMQCPMYTCMPIHRPMYTCTPSTRIHFTQIHFHAVTTPTSMLQLFIFSHYITINH